MMKISNACYYLVGLTLFLGVGCLAAPSTMSDSDSSRFDRSLLRVDPNQALDPFAHEEGMINEDEPDDDRLSSLVLADSMEDQSALDDAIFADDLPTEPQDLCLYYLELVTGVQGQYNRELFQKVFVAGQVPQRLHGFLLCCVNSFYDQSAGTFEHDCPTILGNPLQSIANAAGTPVGPPPGNVGPPTGIPPPDMGPPVHGPPPVHVPPPNVIPAQPVGGIPPQPTRGEAAATAAGQGVRQPPVHVNPQPPPHINPAVPPYPAQGYPQGPPPGYPYQHPPRQGPGLHVPTTQYVGTGYGNPAVSLLHQTVGALGGLGGLGGQTGAFIGPNGPVAVAGGAVASAGGFGGPVAVAGPISAGGVYPGGYPYPQPSPGVYSHPSAGVGAATSATSAGSHRVRSGLGASQPYPYGYPNAGGYPGVYQAGLGAPNDVVAVGATSTGNGRGQTTVFHTGGAPAGLAVQQDSVGGLSSPGVSSTFISSSGNQVHGFQIGPDGQPIPFGTNVGTGAATVGQSDDVGFGAGAGGPQHVGGGVLTSHNIGGGQFNVFRQPGGTITTFTSGGGRATGGSTIVGGGASHVAASNLQPVGAGGALADDVGAAAGGKSGTRFTIVRHRGEGTQGIAAVQGSGVAQVSGPGGTTILHGSTR